MLRNMEELFANQRPPVIDPAERATWSRAIRFSVFLHMKEVAQLEVKHAREKKILAAEMDRIENRLQDASKLAVDELKRVKAESAAKEANLAHQLEQVTD